MEFDGVLVTHSNGCSLSIDNWNLRFGTPLRSEVYRLFMVAVIKFFSIAIEADVEYVNIYFFMFY